ncbi:thioredoxin domain-containing protein 17 isoform 1-T1 [Mergus octosetaceus]
MGWEEKQVRGYSEFVQTAQRYHGRPIFALFCGDKDAEGKSWCPDCVTAEPVVRTELHNMPDESVFIYCLVGDRAYLRSWLKKNVLKQSLCVCCLLKTKSPTSQPFMKMNISLFSLSFQGILTCCPLLSHPPPPPAAMITVK